MVVLNIAMKQDEAIKIVEAIDEHIHLVKKQGMSVFFETPNDDAYLGIIKKTLKASPGFSALYFNLSTISRMDSASLNIWLRMM